MSAVSSATSSSLGSINQTQYLQLLIAELKNQSPLDPVSETDTVAQLAQFSTLEGVQNLGASFDQMLQLQQLTSGASLIGQSVQYTDSNNQTQTGTVSQTSVSNGNVYLTIGSNQVPLNNVTAVLGSST